MAEKKNSKLIWTVLFAVVTVVLCYLFVVVYFYFISPYNISFKLAFWPFVSDKQIGQMYLDATVEVNFNVVDEETFENKQVTVTGVNVSQDGYILVPYNEIKDYDESTTMNIKANSGEIFNGKVLFKEKNYNLAIIKCESASSKPVKLAYVNISKISNKISIGTKVLALASPMQSKNVWTGAITEAEPCSVGKRLIVEDKETVSFVMEGCYIFDLDASLTAYTGGAVFDKSGNLLGLSFENTTQDGSYVLLPVEGIKNILSKVKDCYNKQSTYQNYLASSLVGFDNIELSYYIDASEQNNDSDNIYFNGQWTELSANIVLYSTSDMGGYYLMQDLYLDESNTINANSVIDYVTYNGKTFVIEDKLDLLDALYDLKSGSNVIIHFYELTETESKPRLVTFTVE